jgi:excisionase family DNA binding protein
MTQIETLANAKAVAEHFGVTVATVYTWTRQGRIPCIRPSRGVVRFRMDEVERAIAQPSQERESNVYA